jgi:hypothetical protein
MELDDFKSTGKKEATPGYRKNHLNSEKMNSFIEELKAKDASERKKALTYITMFFVFVAVYAATMRLHQGLMKTGFALLVMAFVLILGYMFWRYRRIRDVDYSAPAIVFLREAEERYKYMTTTDWLVTIPLILLLVTGGCIVVYATLTRYFGDSIIPVVIYLCIMALAVAIGFWASHKDWKATKGWMLDRIRKMIRESGVEE